MKSVRIDLRREAHGRAPHATVLGFGVIAVSFTPARADGEGWNLGVSEALFTIARK